MARSPAKRFFGTLLFLVAVLAFFAFVFLIYADSVNDDNVPFVDKVSSIGLIIAIGLGVIAFLLLLMLLIRKYERREEAVEESEVFFIPEAAPAAPTVQVGTQVTTFEMPLEVTVYDLKKVPGAANAWGGKENDGRVSVYYFPRSVPSGVYVNDYIPVDKAGTLLKMRTLMAGPESEWSDRSPARSRPKPKPEFGRIAPLTKGTGGTSRQMMVIKEVKPQATTASTDAYYDYPGDIHDVEDIEGIGVVYGNKLRELGIHTTARLAYEDSESLARRLDMPKKSVDQWKSMGELMKVSGIGPQYAEALARSGVEGIAELKKRSADALADQVNSYLSGLETNVLGNKITAKRVESWQDAAKGMKRIRLKVPEQ